MKDLWKFVFGVLTGLLLDAVVLGGVMGVVEILVWLLDLFS